jgi:hypothetical protein
MGEQAGTEDGRGREGRTIVSSSLACTKMKTGSDTERGGQATEEARECCPNY